VDGIDLRVAPGQFFGFLGPNGAGKSTTIKMLTGLLAPTSGQIEILGLDLAAHPLEVKRQIGVVPEGMALFGRLTGSEFCGADVRTRPRNRGQAYLRTS
jgi:ABC-2 type transport system ATP-binding protein